MKKTLFALSALVLLTACNKEEAPAPKPAPSPATHLAALATELDWLNLHANKLPGVSAGEAADIRSVIADLGSWVRWKMEAGA